MQTTTRTRILPLSPHRSSTPGSRPPIDCSFALQKPSSALRPRSLAGHATGSAPEVSCNEKDALFCHRAYLFIWYYGQVFQGCPKRGTLVRWPGRSNQSLKVIPSLSWLRLLVSSTPIAQRIEKRLDPIGADHLYNKRGIRDDLPLGFPAFCRFPLTPWAPQSRASSTVPHDLYDSQARKLFASTDDQNQSQSLEYIHLSVDVSIDELVALGRWSPPM